MTFKRRLIVTNLVLVMLPVMVTALFLWLAAGEFYSLSTLPQQARSLGLLIILLAVAVMLGCSAALSVAAARSLMRSVNALTTAVDRIRDGDLTLRAEYLHNDEFRAVFEALGLMRERLAATLRERERAELQKTEMLANISHDLKTPITSIRGYAQGILDGVASTPEKTERYVTIIRDKAEELDRLASDLLIFARLDGPPPVRELRDADLAEVMDGILNGFEGAEIVREWEDSPGRGEFTARLDRGAFARAVRNILGNSVKYAAPGACVIRIGIRRGSGKLILSIADNGPGAADESRIFERFYRGDAARTDPGSGSGLGLSIAKQIAEAHGGEIWARNGKNGGLCVYISIPGKVSV